MMLSREQVRAVDKRAIGEFGLPGAVLMENAGRGAAELLLRLGIQGAVTICCGKGNNGGDGLVIARHLDNHGVAVRVLLFATPDRLTGAAALYYHVAAKARLAICTIGDSTEDQAILSQTLATSDWIIDALFGTGLSGPVRPPLDRVIAAMNTSKARVLAVDIPSGLDCDTGEPLGPTIRADHTATFVAPKLGFANPKAQPWLGRVHVLPIGVPRAVINQGMA